MQMPPDLRGTQEAKREGGMTSFEDLVSMFCPEVFYESEAYVRYMTSSFGFSRVEGKLLKAVKER